MIDTHTTPALPWGAGGADRVSPASTADHSLGPATATANPRQVPLPEVGSHVEVRITCAREGNPSAFFPLSNNIRNTQVKWQIEDEDKVESLVLAQRSLVTHVNAAVDA